MEILISENVRAGSILDNKFGIKKNRVTLIKNENKLLLPPAKTAVGSLRLDVGLSAMPDIGSRNIKMRKWHLTLPHFWCLCSGEQESHHDTRVGAEERESCRTEE